MRTERPAPVTGPPFPITFLAESMRPCAEVTMRPKLDWFNTRLPDDSSKNELRGALSPYYRMYWELLVEWVTTRCKHDSQEILKIQTWEWVDREVRGGKCEKAKVRESVGVWSSLLCLRNT